MCIRDRFEIEQPEPDTEDPDESAVERDDAEAPAQEDGDTDAPQNADQEEGGAR